eukprot:81641-Chlamydomonas_euryale.AAC.22
MGWLRTLHRGVPYVTAPNPLLDPSRLAALNTGIPFVRPLPVTLTLTSSTSVHCPNCPYAAATPRWPAIKHLDIHPHLSNRMGKTGQGPDTAAHALLLE